LWNQCTDIAVYFLRGVGFFCYVLMDNEHINVLMISCDDTMVIVPQVSTYVHAVVFVEASQIYTTIYDTIQHLICATQLTDIVWLVGENICWSVKCLW